MNAAAVEVKPSARLQTHTMNTITICLIYTLACSWFLPSSWSASMFGGGIFMIFFKTKADDFWGPMATVTDACPGMISSILPWKIYKCLKLRLYPLNLLFLFEETQPKQHRSEIHSSVLGKAITFSWGTPRSKRWLVVWPTEKWIFKETGRVEL